MYVAIQTFMSLRGTVFHQGEEISDFKYALLKKEDKKKFAKKDISTNIPPVQPRKSIPTPSRSGGYSPSHYGYGPEPGYTSEAVPTSHYIPHDSYDEPPSHHHSYDTHTNHDSYHSSDSYDSGSSSSDSSSCDSGGGDCGGCDGGGGGGD